MNAVIAVNRSNLKELHMLRDMFFGTLKAGLGKPLLLSLALSVIPVALHTLVIYCTDSMLIGGMASFLFLMPFIIIPYKYGIILGFCSVGFIFSASVLAQQSLLPNGSFQSSYRPFLLVLSIFIVVGMAIIGSLYRKLIKAIEYEKILQKEAHHRIKNNLNFISSLISLSENALDTDDPVHLLQTIRNTVFASAHIHDALSFAKEFDQINLDDHLQKTFPRLHIESEHTASDARSFKPITSGRIAFSLSLILNELMENDRKHQQNKEIVSSLLIQPDTSEHCAHVVLTNNNSTLPEHFSFTQHSVGLGLLILNSLVEQHSGKLEIRSRSPATYEILLYSS